MEGWLAGMRMTKPSIGWTRSSNFFPVKGSLTDLPEDYLVALLKFHHYLNQVAKGALNQLKLAAVASPPLRNVFVRSVPVSATSSMMEVMSKLSIKMDKVTGHLI